MIGRPAALAALPGSYGPLFDRAAAVFEADERVRAMWLHGALARGQADAASDMDISVAIADDGFAASWRDWLAAITPALTARPIAAGSFYALTPIVRALRRHRRAGRQAIDHASDQATCRLRSRRAG